ncbi:MAG: AmpG family muropeptide MFS transporter [Desulfobulbaceae bacterium]|uniref:AmpG family muropeptide MFS transporter n=1 Tax=Candidatus Desulfobia pelagia TaxID=2841692 RepID=A0A8J6TGL5_9BACT|nr:AmpG family muropeptide MFS transporter [Candidatus Desulfobia pelagia]
MKKNSKGQAGWLESVRVYSNRRVLSILFLGFSSGLPLALTFGTLSLWLAEAGVSKTNIGLFALAGTPYTFKFLWAPLVDRMPLPFLTRRLGRRRSWALVTQVFLMAAIFSLGATDPSSNAYFTALLALMVAFCSATQDIVIDAYRVEILEENQYGAGAAMIVLGYRIGMLVSGAGALYLASFFGWFAAYAFMGCLVMVGMVTVLLNPEPINSSPLQREDGLVAWIRDAVIAPFSEFMGRKGWLLILLFILLYKFGDALAGVMSNPFYLELGFSKIDIANISKAFGLAATIIGGIIGGMLVSRMGIVKSLVVCGLLQMFSNLMFVYLAMKGHNLAVLTATIAIENLSGGMGTAAFVGYLSGLCNVAYTATQYALLSSFMAFGRTLLSSTGGWFADQLSWVSFFLLTTAAAIPGLLLLAWMARRFPQAVRIKKGV